MKKALIIAASILSVVIIVGVIISVNANKDTRTLNDYAEKDEKGRYLTIVNETDQIINEVHVTVGDGSEIEKMKQTNPDESSFSIEIPKQYSEYDTFTVTLIDRHDLKYIKEITKPIAKTKKCAYFIECRFFNE